MDVEGGRACESPLMGPGGVGGVRACGEAAMECGEAVRV